MAKLDHEKKNREDKAKRLESPVVIAGVADQKTFQGHRKLTFWDLKKKELAAKEEAAQRRKQKRKGKKQCPHCNQWVKKTIFDRHIAKMHESLSCPVCNCPILGRKALKIHLASHNVLSENEITELTKLPKVRKKKKRKRQEPPKRNFLKCPECNKGIDARDWKHHLAWHQLSTTCPACKQKFPNWDKTIQHISYTHGPQELAEWTRQIRKTRR